LCLFFGIAVLLLVKRHSSGRTTFQGEDHFFAVLFCFLMIKLAYDDAESGSPGG